MDGGEDETSAEEYLPVVQGPVDAVVRGVAHIHGQCRICTWIYLKKIRKDQGKEMPEMPWSFTLARIVHRIKKLFGFRC